VDGQCGKLVTVIGDQFITLTIDICVQHSWREALRRAGLSAAVETCYKNVQKIPKMRDSVSVLWII